MKTTFHMGDSATYDVEIVPVYTKDYNPQCDVCKMAGEGLEKNIQTIGEKFFFTTPELSDFYRGPDRTITITLDSPHCATIMRWFMENQSVTIDYAQIESFDVSTTFGGVLVELFNINRKGEVKHYEL